MVIKMYNEDDLIFFEGIRYKVVSGTMYLDNEYILVTNPSNDIEKVFKCTNELEELMDKNILEQVMKYM